MKGSDTDIMMTDSTIEAYEGDDKSNPFISCRYDSMLPDLKPGYVMVEIGMRENISITDKSKISVRELSRFLNCILNLLSIEDYRRRNAFVYQVCPEVYCHLLRFLCYLRQADLPHSEEEFDKMIQVHFMGSEYEKCGHDMAITMMKIMGRIISRNVQNNCESDIYTLNDFFVY
ncbi:unnamed protein product [Mytilus edulis]|uniref:Uncharacterized protein n=1 Tax=Mytilus edulis TaxID=6550 RepID=A0A8S3PR33_MYTED|nr:unnamed protein product [Mytilus edulis]